MQIAYLNKGKAKAKTSTDQMLERAYLRDMRLVWNKCKDELLAVGISETQYIERAKEKFRVRKGLFMK